MIIYAPFPAYEATRCLGIHPACFQPCLEEEEKAGGIWNCSYAQAKEYVKDKALCSLEKGALQTKDCVLSLGSAVFARHCVLTKPAGETCGKEHVRLLSGRKHQVITGVWIKTPKGNTVYRSSITRVSVRQFSPQDIDFFSTCERWKNLYQYPYVAGLLEPFIRLVNGTFLFFGWPVHEIFSGLCAQGIVLGRDLGM